MAQRFLITAPIIRETMVFSSTSLQEAFCQIPSKTPEHLTAFLAIPLRPKICILTCNPKVNAVPGSQFSSLPLELHDIILDNLEIEDVVSLSLTSRHFWNVGHTRIDTFLMSFLGAWAGKDIICLAESHLGSDFSPAFITGLSKQMSKLTVKETSVWHIGDFHHWDFEDCADAPSYRSDIYTHLRTRLSNPTVRHELSKMPPLISTHLQSVLFPSFFRFYPDSETYILRNLTTKEFVLPEAIAIDRRFIRGPCIKHVGFGHALLSRISLVHGIPFPFATAALRFSECMNHAWVGHCFDITTLARHLYEEKEGEWKDVSNEVAKDISAVWEGRRGCHWREDILALE